MEMQNTCFIWSLSIDIQGSKADLQQGKKFHWKGKKQLPKGKHSELFSYTIKCNIAVNQSVSKSKGESCKGIELGMLARIFFKG